METSYVVVGPPAAGKSTVARLLAGACERGVHVPVDDLREMVVSGLVLPSPDWSPALVEQVTAARRVALSALAFYNTAGFTVVLDDFVDPPGLREYDGAIGSGLATGVLLRPDPEVAVARARQREATPEGAAYITEGVRLVYSRPRRPAAPPHRSRLARRRQHPARPRGRPPPPSAPSDNFG